jgi:lipid-binding SYLF domain-containing protein
MFRSVNLVLCFMLAAVTVLAQNKEQGRLENAGLVMEEVLNIPDSIPQDLLNNAECVIVVPSMTKVAIGIGGSYGRGAMVCRSGENFDGAWGGRRLVDILQKKAVRIPSAAAR